MLDKNAVIAYLITMQDNGDMDGITIADGVQMLITRLTEQAKQSRQGLNHSRAYFLVNFALTRWVRRTLADMPAEARYANLTTEILDQLRVATRTPLVNERRSMEAGAGSIRVAGNVSPDVLTNYRSTLAAIGNGCAEELQRRAAELVNATNDLADMVHA